MKLSLQEIKTFLGFKDKKFSQVIADIDIKYPNLKYSEIFDIFKQTCEIYLTKNDYIEDYTNWYNKNFSGMNPNQIREKYNIKDNLYSTNIFKNFYMTIDLSDRWNEQIQKKMFLKSFLNYKQYITKKLKKDYRDHILLDLFEITCEFIDLIQKKLNEINRI